MKFLAMLVSRNEIVCRMALVMGRDLGPLVTQII